MQKSQQRPILGALAAAAFAATCGSAVFAGADEDTQAVLDHHLAAFGSGDIEAFLADYTATSVIMNPAGKVTGPDEIRAAVQLMMDEFAKPGMTFEMTHMAVSGRMAYVVWKATTADNVYEIATDSFLIEDGKIISQTFTPKITPVK